MDNLDKYFEAEIDDAQNVDDKTITEDEYAEYEASFGKIIKRVWIVIQVIIMFQFMIRGIVYYSRTIDGWGKVKMLLVFQGCQFVYLALNEFIWMNMTGTYLNLLFCSYGHFQTFCIVMDSCMTEQDDKQNSYMYWTNKIGRIFFHTLFIILLSFVYFARTCVDHLYPPIFLLLGVFIFSQQVFDLVLYWNNYMIDWDKLPPTHINGMWYNRKLFEEQTRVLFFANLLFGGFSLLTIWMGFTMMNKNEENLEEASHIICFRGNLWVESSLLGTIFLMAHQILILLQINAS